VRAYTNPENNQSQKMLASTVQFSTYDQTPATRPHQPPGSHRSHSGMRCRPALQRRRQTPGTNPEPALSGPNSVPTTPSRERLRSTHTRRHAVLGAGSRPAAELVSVPPSSTTPGTCSHPRPDDRRVLGAALDHFQRGKRPVLLRKEVIQPHLPVRLPCYDFVPIADPAFDGSLHKGWATGFGRYRLS
jgi:hypothetical protein